MLFLFFILLAFAQVQDSIAFTDVTMEGDKVLISGIVDQVFGEFPITVMVINPDGNVINFKQLTVDESLTFDVTINKPAVPGEYTVKAQYGTPNRVAETTFTVTGEELIEEPIIEEPIKEEKPVKEPERVVEIIDDSFDYSNLEYDFDGEVLQIYGTESNSIVLDVNGGTELKITLPRAVIDSQNNGKDMAFQIFVDGEPIGYGEERTNGARILTIGFPEGAQTVEIMGTFLVPEFEDLGLFMLVSFIVIISGLIGMRFFIKNE